MHELHIKYINELCIHSQFGYTCDPNKPLWLNIQETLLKMPLPQLFKQYRLKQSAFHNLCTTLQPPPGTHKLLWLGLKFCIEKPLPKPSLTTYMERLTYDVRIKASMAASEDSIVINQSGQRIFLEGDTEYDPKLYLPNPDYTPNHADPKIEQALVNFADRLGQLIRANRQRRRHNIPAATRRIIEHIDFNNPNFIVTFTDKNLGPAILERSTYKRRCLQDHLLDTTSYKQLTPDEAASKVEWAKDEMMSILDHYRHHLAPNEITYFKRVFQLQCRLPQFYIAPKVHKTPWKTRPIVSCTNSLLGYLSKWVDRQLQKVVHLCPGYIKDSNEMLQKLQQLDPLPPTTVIIVADAVSMYTNIDTQHGIQTLKEWLDAHRAELPKGFPTGLVVAATELIMTCNIFQFDDTFWHQISGTAMGTPVACTFATIYFAQHEDTSYLKKYHHAHQLTTAEAAAAPLLLYGRLIDDTVQFWDTAKLPPGVLLYNLTKQIEQDMAFGILTWEVNPPSREVNFLDLNISITPDGEIVTKTFTKPMNLHLYIPPESAHSKGVLKSLIFGNVFRYWQQNSHTSDFIRVTKDFYCHLLNRGYTPKVLNPIFYDAAERITERAEKTPDPNTGGTTAAKQLFLHWEYHPRDITRYEIRSVFNTTLAPILAQPPLGIQRLTIAYKNPPNLRRLLTRTQLQEPAGDRASLYTERLKQNDDLTSAQTA
jgi:hypothetical protein